MTAKGTVFNIARFAIHDGPGIRTVVFLKGCPLRCAWCSTPESHLLSPEMGYHADRCIRCGRCVEVCPPKAITLTEDHGVITDKKLCDGCGRCVEVCPVGARTMLGIEMTVEEVLTEVEKDALFYWNSGGGMTLSGGEPTMQPEFSGEILKTCQERGIHTAMETCGHVQWEVLDGLARHLDLVYVDVKHMSSVAHKTVTGKGNELIRENIEKIAAIHPDTELVIRVPVIPGCNDSAENIIKTARFVGQLKGVERIELLPYHRLGVSKYSVLLREYDLRHVEAPQEDHLRNLEEHIRSCGLEVQIGG